MYVILDPPDLGVTVKLTIVIVFDPASKEISLPIAPVEEKDCPETELFSLNTVVPVVAAVIATVPVEYKLKPFIVVAKPALTPDKYQSLDIVIVEATCITNENGVTRV